MAKDSKQLSMLLPISSTKSSRRDDTPNPDIVRISETGEIRGTRYKKIKDSLRSKGLLKQTS